MNLTTNRGRTLITNNPKTVLWTTVGSLFLTIISVRGAIWYYKRKKKCDTQATIMECAKKGEIEIQKKRNDTECDILKVTAQTACKMMEQATNIIPELNGLKTEIHAAKEELGGMKEALLNGVNNIPTPPGSTPPESDEDSEIVLQGHSSAELFNRSRTDNSSWIVWGYMKVGMVNLLVAAGGVGKSIFMVQIALAVSKGARPEFLPDDCCVSVQQKVVYYRLEDFSDELQGKYGEGKVLRNSGIEWFLLEDLPASTLEGFIAHLKVVAASVSEDTLVCVDPATKLDGYKHTEFIKGVEDAMAIAKTRNITLTIVGTVHLDEIKDWTVLTNSDIKGGDKGLQQAGSVTALRRERTGVEKYRFLQSLKEPKGSPKPFDGKVLVCKVVKEILDENNKYLHYQFDSIKFEEQARPEKPKTQSDGILHASSTVENKPTAPNQKVTPEVAEKIKSMLANGMKHGKIAKKLGLSVKTISRHKKEFGL